MRIMHPNPGTDRTWTRSKWKAMDGYCRTMSRLMQPYLPALERATTKALEDLLIFGTAKVRITAEDLL
jgi:hypothetical protein